MSKTKRFLTRRKGMALAGTLLLVAAVLIACGGEPTTVATQPTTAPTAPPAPTIMPTQPPTATSAPTEPPTPTDTPTEPPPTDTPVPTDTPAPTDSPTPEAVDDSACIACHTDQEILKTVAKVEATPEPLSEGEG
jgi:hypothetical protein